MNLLRTNEIYKTKSITSCLIVAGVALVGCGSASQEPPNSEPSPEKTSLPSEILPCDDVTVKTYVKGLSNHGLNTYEDYQTMIRESPENSNEFVRASLGSFIINSNAFLEGLGNNVDINVGNNSILTFNITDGEEKQSAVEIDKLVQTPGQACSVFRLKTDYATDSFVYQLGDQETSIKIETPKCLPKNPLEINESTPTDCLPNGLQQNGKPLTEKQIVDLSVIMGTLTKDRGNSLQYPQNIPTKSVSA